MDKVIIFGCGPTGLRTYGELKNNNEVIAFFDNDKNKEGHVIEGISVYRPSKNLLETLEYDYIVIASVYGKWEIKEQLYLLGVTDEKIRMHARRPDVMTPFLECLAEDFKEENVGGACAEIGVFRGENACKINKIFPEKKLHLYDTFEGFAEQDVERERVFGRGDVATGQFGDTSVDLVMRNMEYPENVVIHKGYFPDTAKGLDEDFCFVRIDLDLSAPTEAALEIFAPLMVSGGIICVHDYFNQYPGVRKVVRKFMSQHPELCKLPIADAMTIAIAGF